MTEERNDIETTGDGERDEAAQSGQATPQTETSDELTRALQERDEFYDRYLRTQAELENYRKRVRREREEDLRYASVGLVRELLPVLDNLDRAIQASETATDSGDLVQGVKMVAQQVHDVLARHDVKSIDAEGEPFDPNRHEALQQIPSADVPPMTVVQQLERGYVLHDRVLRPSKVIVSSGPPTEAEE